jgi:hypothetical protein
MSGVVLGQLVDLGAPTSDDVVPAMELFEIGELSDRLWEGYNAC